MNKNFELWLDESGDFENQHELEGTTRKPSLIGGFLVEEEVADKIDFGGLIDSNRNHAMELEEDDKKIMFFQYCRELYLMMILHGGCRWKP